MFVVAKTSMGGRLMDLHARAQAHLVLDSEPEIQVSRTDGNYVIDANGRRYLDFLMGWCVGNLGWSCDEIADKLRRFDGPKYVPPNYLYKRQVELAELLAEITPGSLSKCIRTATGTESVEAAIKLARLYTGRKQIAAIKDSYHGNSIAITETVEDAEVAAPLDAHALEHVARLLKTRKYAAFLMEPIICNLGVEIPTHTFMQGLRKLCDEYGTLLVLDEVASGFGRTGKLFAMEHFGVQPDILCLGKALAGGYAPISATITTDEIMDDVEDDWEFYSTFGWHPVAVEAAIATLKFFKRRASLMKQVNEMGDYFADRLSQMHFKTKSVVRVKGVAIGVDLEDSDYVDKLVSKCRELGLLLSAQDKYVVMWPAVTLDLRTAKQGLDILESAVASVRAPSHRRTARAA
jgi:4-aminobutyrate aminotransferase-like enzyme